MVKKAVIFDLDNTIYPVSSLGEELYEGLFTLIKAAEEHAPQYEEIKQAILRKPFRYVAKEFNFNSELIQSSMELLSDLEYKKPLNPFEDYAIAKQVPGLKFLVTMGFTKMQWSKIKLLNIEADFEACFVLDPLKEDTTKKDIFKVILKKYGLKPEDVLVVGDDVQSEIKAGLELGMKTLVYDKGAALGPLPGYSVISHYSQLAPFLTK